MGAGWLAALAAMVAVLAVSEAVRVVSRRWGHAVVRRFPGAAPGASGDGGGRPADAVTRHASVDRDRDPASIRLRRDAARGLLERHGVRAPDGLAKRLAAAGISHEGAAEQAMALKCAAAIGAALVALPVALGTSAAGALLLVGALPVAAFLVPDWIAARRARDRARQLSARAPELLERVRLGAEAGLSPQRAVALAVGHADGLLAAELRAALGAIELGMPAAQALRSLCARCPVPEVHALAAALRRSARHGAPLAPAVARLAASSRAERARQVHERAQGAAPKIQLVVALLLVPAALLLIAAALLSGMR